MYLFRATGIVKDIVISSFYFIKIGIQRLLQNLKFQGSVVIIRLFFKVVFKRKNIILVQSSLLLLYVNTYLLDTLLYIYFFFNVCYYENDRT